MKVEPKKEYIFQRHGSPVPENKLYVAKIKQLYEQADVAIYGATTVAVLLVVLLWQFESHRIFILWLSVGAVYGVRLLLIKALFRTDPQGTVMVCGR